MLPQKLTESSISKALPREREYKLFDGGGLYLLITPKGGRYWRMKYRHGGRDKGLSLGVYPEISLQSAREKHSTLRQLLSQGLDPSSERRRDKQEAKEDAARTLAEEKAAAQASRVKVTVFTEGGLEVWKGRQVLRLSLDEARSVHKLLGLLLREE